ncbi:MAG: TSUP family transporter [Verrucomicrobiota bacterium]|nr:TSUP family transporter [Verrucomicrobiota bacterium]
MLQHVLILCCFSLVAGFVDAAVGGGGLIQLPAALILLPGVPVPTILGTNKLASICGTSFALQRYARTVKIDWQIVGPSALVAFLFSFGGARAINLLDPKLLRPLILFLLVGVAIYVLLAKNLGLVHKPKHTPDKARLLGMSVGAVLGFYDGFFGAGMGSFLIFAFVGLFGFDFLSASASAKAVNWATNLASLIYFAATGQILFAVGLAMAASNVCGSAIGTHLAIAKGSRFVRIFFLVTVCGLIAKLTQTLLWP